MNNLEKLVEKHVQVDSGYPNPIDAEDFLLAVKDSSFLILKESGKLIVNLPSYVSKPNTKEAMFEDELFLNHLYTAVRLLDNGIDIRLEQIVLELRKIKEKGSCRKRFRKAFSRLLLESKSLGSYRPIEIRVIGITEMANSLSVPDKDLDVFYTALNLLAATTIYTASIDLAQERSQFPCWNMDSIKESKFLSKLFSLEENSLMREEILTKLQTTGIRNTINIRKI